MTTGSLMMSVRVRERELLQLGSKINWRRGRGGDGDVSDDVTQRRENCCEARSTRLNIVPWYQLVFNYAKAFESIHFFKRHEGALKCF
jgi:hypothetical protein